MHSTPITTAKSNVSVLGTRFSLIGVTMIASIAGGGRYDEMIGLFAGRTMEATGISIGVERLITVMKNRSIVNPKKTTVQVYVAHVNDKVKPHSLSIAQMLREKGTPTDIDLRGRSLRGQMEQASTLNVPYVIIVGPDELSRDAVKLRNMSTQTEREVTIHQLSEAISAES